MNKQPIFDRNRLRLHRDRAAKTIERYNFLIELSSDDIMERLVSMDIPSDSILEIGAGAGALTRKLMTTYPLSNIIATDISKEMLKLNPAVNKRLLNEEKIKFEGEKFDIIVSALNIHNINDIQMFFAKIAELLKPNGVFVASMFGAGSLAGLRSFLLKAEIDTGYGHSPHIAPFATANDIYRLLQLAGFEFIITDTHKIEIEYDSPLACMRELRNMCESSTLICGARPLTKAILQQAQSGAFTDHAVIITLTASHKAVKTHLEAYSQSS